MMTPEGGVLTLGGGARLRFLRRGPGWQTGRSGRSRLSILRRRRALRRRRLSRRVRIAGRGRSRRRCSGGGGACSCFRRGRRRTRRLSGFRAGRRWSRRGRFGRLSAVRRRCSGRSSVRRRRRCGGGRIFAARSRRGASEGLSGGVLSTPEGAPSRCLGHQCAFLRESGADPALLAACGCGFGRVDWVE